MAVACLEMSYNGSIVSYGSYAMARIMALIYAIAMFMAQLPPKLKDRIGKNWKNPPPPPWIRPVRVLYLGR